MLLGSAVHLAWILPANGLCCNNNRFTTPKPHEEAEHHPRAAKRCAGKTLLTLTILFDIYSDRCLWQAVRLAYAPGPTWHDAESPRACSLTRFGMTQRLRELGQVEVGGEEEMTKNPESLTWRGRNKSKQHLHLSRQSMTNFLLLRHSSLSYTVVYHPPKRPMSGEAFHWDSLSMLLWVWVIVSIVIISQPTPESRVTADAKPSERTSTFCKSG